jgi:TM2 domain-containing membrane protein YozV
MTDYDGRRSNAPAAHANTSHWLPRVLLGIGGFFVWAFVMATIGLTWGANAIGVFIVLLLVGGVVGGKLYQRHLERQR